MSALRAGELTSPPAPPGEMNEAELRVWAHICSQLRAAGIDHTTFGLAGMVVVKTYCEWMDAQEQLERVKAEKGGSYMTKTPNGYEQPHQLYYIARNLKRELLQWLPECCLTIPSLVTAKAKVGDAGRQDDLFGDLVDHATVARSEYSSA